MLSQLKKFVSIFCPIEKNWDCEYVQKEKFLVNMIIRTQWEYFLFNWEKLRLGVHLMRKNSRDYAELKKIEYFLSIGKNWDWEYVQ